MDIQAVQRSFDAITRKADEFTELFYRTLFDDFPQLTVLFEEVDLHSQRKKLFAMLTLAITHLTRMDLVIPVLHELGRRHRTYGVSDELYGAFVSTFLEVLKQTLSGDWNPDIAAAWQSALDQICHHMMTVPAPLGSGVGDPAPEVQSDDLEVLMQISGQATILGSHARLFESFLARKIQDHDLEIARVVQQTLLPERLPESPGYEIHACYDPARAVGGDYYDCMQLEDGRICVAFGDVSGKGMPAAIVMSRLASAVETTARFSSDLRESIGTLNSHMCQRAAGGRFVTFVLLVLDPKTHRIGLANAGHRPPVIRGPGGKTTALAPEIAGPPLGILDGLEYEVAEHELLPGETVMLFTDGVDEARNPRGEHYGMSRLTEFLDNPALTPAELGLGLLRDVRRYSAGRPSSDDVAIVTLSRRR